MAIRRALIRQRVEALLSEAKISQPAVNPIEIANVLDLRVVDQQAPPDGGEISGCLIRRPGLPPVIGVNPAQHENRRRFTIAHEIGHFLLHEGEKIHVSHTQSFRVNFRDADSGTAVFPDEKEANYFAAELLMPSRFLAKDIDQRSIDLTADEDGTLLELAQRYKVSTQALTYRLINLGWLRPS